MLYVLYISMITPYKDISNAGGKTFYYYLHTLSKVSGVNITVLCKKMKDDSEPGCDLENITFHYVKNPIEYRVNDIAKLLRDVNAKVNPFYRYGNTLRSSIYEEILDACKNLQQSPDVIVLEFTQMVLLAPEIKTLFPSARIIASEHDVTFLGLERKYLGEKKLLKRGYKYIQFKNMVRRELNSLRYCDLVMPHNIKDKMLLIEQGISPDKIWTLTPYFMAPKADRININNDIVFYGAMNRAENEEAAIWFIQNVMPLLKEYLSIRFVVLGAHPSERMKSYESDRIHITGFVEHPIEYLSKCMCAVIPLHYGAGIKVKVLECFALGIPVLTGNVGIEGIPAQKENDYLHCETPQEYKEGISAIIENRIDLERLEHNTKSLMQKYFDLEVSGKEYVEVIKGKINHDEK